MIDTTTLTKRIHQYITCCRRPTFKGLGRVLQVSGQTVANVYYGTYNGKQYGTKPQYNRVIDNADFEIVRAVFIDRG